MDSKLVGYAISYNKLGQYDRYGVSYNKQGQYDRYGISYNKHGQYDRYVNARNNLYAHKMFTF